MELTVIATIAGLLSFLCGFILWAIQLVARITRLVDSVSKLNESHKKLSERVNSFKDEFQSHFLKIEIEDRNRANLLEKRLDKIERGLIAHIAKHQGTLPDIGE